MLVKKRNKNTKTNCIFHLFQAIDFVDKLLRYDHEDRPTAKEAMVYIFTGTGSGVTGLHRVVCAHYHDKNVFIIPVFHLIPSSIFSNLIAKFLFMHPNF